MGQYTVMLTKDEEKALLTGVISIQEWLDNLLKAKVNKCIDRIVLEHSDRQPAKLSRADKLQIVHGVDVQSAADLATEADEEPQTRE